MSELVHHAECDACPFLDSEAAIQAQNWGCLPTPGEVFAIRQETGCNWGCHSRDGICAGYVAACREHGLEYRSLPTLDHGHWYYHGQEAAAAHAIATEARRAETTKIGSVHEGAGPQDIAQIMPEQPPMTGNTGVTPDTYRGWEIHQGRWPEPAWMATGPNYDASYEGPEDGWVDNGEKADAPTGEALIEEIDIWFEENGE